MRADDLADALERMHGASAERLEAVHVLERHGGQVVWEGDVQVFALKGHPSATRAYAWSHETDAGGRKYYAVLHVPPVDSPEAAVRAAILKDLGHQGRQPRS